MSIEERLAAIEARIAALEMRATQVFYPAATSEYIQHICPSCRLMNPTVCGSTACPYVTKITCS